MYHVGGISCHFNLSSTVYSKRSAASNFITSWPVEHSGQKGGTVKLGDKERFDKEQIGFKEPFPLTNFHFTS